MAFLIKAFSLKAEPIHYFVTDGGSDWILCQISSHRPPLVFRGDKMSKAYLERYLYVRRKRRPHAYVCYHCFQQLVAVTPRP